MNVRRLAAINLYGTTGAPIRRAMYLAEFNVATVLLTIFGAWLVGRGTVALDALGAYIVSVALNYAALAVHADRLIGAGALERELDGVDLEATLSRSGLDQLWLLVPLAMVGLAIRDALFPKRRTEVQPADRTV